MLVEHVHSVRSIYSKINCGYSSRTAFICTKKKHLVLTWQVSGKYLKKVPVFIQLFYTFLSVL